MLEQWPKSAGDIRQHLIMRLKTFNDFKDQEEQEDQSTTKEKKKGRPDESRAFYSFMFFF